MSDSEVVLGLPAGAEAKLDRAQIKKIEPMKISLMPADLQKTMTTQELVDVVEYLTTLKKP